MAKEGTFDGLSCPVSQYEVLEAFDYIDLSKICEFLQKHTGGECRLVLDWYAADLGIKHGRAALCIDIAPEKVLTTDPSAIFLYKGPRTKDSPCIAALGKVAQVKFLKGEIAGKEPWYFVEITDRAEVVARFSATRYQIYSPAYLR